VGEQRLDWTIDEAGGEGFFFRGTAFALEESAWDATGGISLFDVINRQRKEVLAGLCFAPGNDSRQHDGIAHRDQHAAGRLARDLACLERDHMRAVLKTLGGFIEHLRFLSMWKRSRGCRAELASPGASLRHDAIRAHAAVSTARDRCCTVRYVHTAARNPVLRTSWAKRPAARPRAGSFAIAQGARLFAQAEAFDQSLVRLGISALEVVEQLAAAADHLQKATSRVMILDVCLEML